MTLRSMTQCGASHISADMPLKAIMFLAVAEHDRQHIHAVTKNHRIDTIELRDPWMLNCWQMQ